MPLITSKEEVKPMLSISDNLHIENLKKENYVVNNENS